jgi:hypothetical protein
MDFVASTKKTFYRRKIGFYKSDEKCRFFFPENKKNTTSEKTKKI